VLNIHIKISIYSNDEKQLVDNTGYRFNHWRTQRVKAWKVKGVQHPQWIYWIFVFVFLYSHKNRLLVKGRFCTNTWWQYSSNKNIQLYSPQC